MKPISERRQISGEWVKALRKDLGLSQDALAEALGVSRIGGALGTQGLQALQARGQGAYGLRGEKPGSPGRFGPRAGTTIDRA
ncbi:MAG: helix-turn-helix transcriptional regulator [bacterium]